MYMYIGIVSVSKPSKINKRLETDPNNAAKRDKKRHFFCMYIKIRDISKKKGSRLRNDLSRNVKCDDLSTQTNQWPGGKELLSPCLNPGYTPCRHPRERRDESTLLLDILPC